MSGRTANALTHAPVGGITVALVDDHVSTTSDANGAFRISSAGSGLCSLSLSGENVLPRDTQVRVPVDGLALTLIPSDFDLPAFDEMCRSEGPLRRWTTTPSLVIIDAVLKYTGLEDGVFTALPEHIGDSDRASIVADLEWGLPQLSGQILNAFASVSVETPAPGASVSFFSREGTIVVARFSGLSDSSGYWGYGRWARRGDAIVAGAIMLDRSVDASGFAYTRSLRVHELGHALGYGHVTRRQSFMNHSAELEPNDFDRDSARLAFERPPGNLSPDRDPSTGTTALIDSGSSSRLIWGPAAN